MCGSERIIDTRYITRSMHRETGVPDGLGKGRENTMCIVRTGSYLGSRDCGRHGLQLGRQSVDTHLGHAPLVFLNATRALELKLVQHGGAKKGGGCGWKWRNTFGTPETPELLRSSFLCVTEQQLGPSHSKLRCSTSPGRGVPAVPMSSFGTRAFANPSVGPHFASGPSGRIGHQNLRIGPSRFPASSKPERFQTAHALPPNSVPKLKQQLGKGSERSDPRTTDPTTRRSTLSSSSKSSKKANRWARISRLMDDSNNDESDVGAMGASRINTYATADGYDLEILKNKLMNSKGVWSDPEQLDDETIISRLCDTGSANEIDEGVSDESSLSCRTTVDTRIAFFFEYGIVVFWGLSPEEERAATRDLLSTCEMDPFPVDAVEVDTTFFAFADPEDPNEAVRFKRPSPSPSFRASVDDSNDDASVDEEALFGALEFKAIQILQSREREFATVVDDVVAIPPSQAGDAAVMLAASHALAQSTKLAVYEQRASELADDTEYIPKAMAKTGDVDLTQKEASKLRGRVFLQRADLNVASNLLDQPEFLWGAPDRYAKLYEETRDYLEIETRVDIVNTRLLVLEDLVGVVVTELETKNGTRLELIVIWLIVIEVVIGLVEIWGIVGLGEV